MWNSQENPHLVKVHLDIYPGTKWEIIWKVSVRRERNKVKESFKVQVPDPAVVLEAVVAADRECFWGEPPPPPQKKSCGLVGGLPPPLHPPAGLAGGVDLGTTAFLRTCLSCFTGLP